MTKPQSLDVDIKCLWYSVWQPSFSSICNVGRYRQLSCWIERFCVYNLKNKIVSQLERGTYWVRYLVPISHFLYTEPSRKGPSRGFIVYLIKRPFSANVTLNQVWNPLSGTTLWCPKDLFTKSHQFALLAKDLTRQCVSTTGVYCVTFTIRFNRRSHIKRGPKFCLHCAYKYDWTKWCHAISRGMLNTKFQKSSTEFLAYQRFRIAYLII